MKKAILGLLLILSLSVSAFAERYPGTYFDLNNLEANDSGYIVAIVNGDMFRVFSKELGDYKTELQQKKFLATEEAKTYQKKIAELKNIIQNQDITTVYQLRKAQFSDYDVKNGGFWVTLGDSYNDGDNISLNSFLCDKVKIYKKESSITYYQIFIPVNETIADKMEENRNLVLKQEMKISGTRILKTTANGLVFTENLPVASSLKFIVVDKSTNEVYIEKQY